MDQTLDQVIKTRKIKFNGRSMQQGQPKQQFNKRSGGPGFVKNQPQQRRQNFGQFRPRGQFVRNFNQRRPQQQFGGRFNAMGGGIQKRNQGQFMMGNRNFQQRRQFVPMQQGYGQIQQQRPMFRRNNMMYQPRRFQQRNNFGQMRFQQNRPMSGMRQQNQGGMRQQQQNQPTKLYISNLDFGVTNQDVKELFYEFGPMVRYGVNHSATGRSVGSAEVFFKNKISAIKAVQKYNGVTLDGRPMKLEIAGGAAPVMQNQQRQRPMMQANNRPMMQRRLPQQQMGNKMMKFVPNNAAKQIVAQAALKKAKRNFGTRKFMGGRVMKSKMMMNKKKAAPNVEQLDADLDAYAASKD